MEELLNLFDKNFIYVHPACKDFSIIETQERGQGSCYFKSKNDVLIIKAKNNNTPLWSLKNKKCAEGAFVVINKNCETISLHIIEMKSKLSYDEFEKVIEQFKGMYLMSLSVMSILRLELPKEITTYIAYKNETVIDKNHEKRIPRKNSLGEKDFVLESWKNEKISLYHNNFARLIKGQRTDNGKGFYDYDFGEVN